MNKNEARDIWLATLANDGGTFYATTGEPFTAQTGYAVAVQNSGETDLTIDTDMETILSVIQSIPDEFGTRFVGTWIDDQNRLYIDPIIIMDELDDALELGIEFGQQAIWDFAANSEIYL